MKRIMSRDSYFLILDSASDDERVCLESQSTCNGKKADAIFSFVQWQETLAIRLTYHSVTQIHAACKKSCQRKAVLLWSLRIWCETHSQRVNVTATLAWIGWKNGVAFRRPIAKRRAAKLDCEHNLNSQLSGSTIRTWQRRNLLEKVYLKRKNHLLSLFSFLFLANCACLFGYYCTEVTTRKKNYLSCLWNERN